MENSKDEFVNIPVPRQYVTQVYGFIASLESGGGESRVETSPSSDVAAATLSESWPEDLIIRQYRESPESMKKFQQYLAEHAGQDFSSTEIAEAIGAEHGWNSIAGALGAYGRRVKNRYKRSTFPFNQNWDHEHGEMRHGMTPEVAEIILPLA
jgi:hypothetical protein